MHFTWRRRDYVNSEFGQCAQKTPTIKKTLWRSEFSTLVKQEGVHELKISQKSINQALEYILLVFEANVKLNKISERINSQKFHFGCAQTQKF